MPKEIPVPVRAHVVLPEDLLERVDRAAGKRRRSRFVEEAVREKLDREAQAAALEAGAGVLDRGEYPEWSSPERTSSWVAGRRELDARRSPGLEP
jgi:predicted transcriptional regulator